MNLEPKSAMHATQDELIAYIYHPENGHIANCSECQRQISAMLAQRARIEAAYCEEPSFDFLAAQRRKIYARRPALAALGSCGTGDCGHLRWSSNLSGDADPESKLA